jgi:hypothetical protein
VCCRLQVAVHVVHPRPVVPRLQAPLAAYSYLSAFSLRPAATHTLEFCIGYPFRSCLCFPASAGTSLAPTAPPGWWQQRCSLQTCARRSRAQALQWARWVSITSVCCLHAVNSTVVLAMCVLSVRGQTTRDACAGALCKSVMLESSISSRLAFVLWVVPPQKAQSDKICR